MNIKAHSKNPLIALLPIFLVMFIDSMGLGLLFPILNSLLVSPTSSVFLSLHAPLSERDLFYGIVVGIFMICWFFGAAVLGDLSDIWGRKKPLLICLLGAFIGYWISAVAVVYHSLAFLIVGRVVAGFTAGSQPIAQAAVIDVTQPEHKARNIGLILLSASLGFVFGPIFGGVLSDTNLVSWFTYSTPLYFAAGISLLNAILLQVMYKEHFQKVTGKKVKLYRAVEIFVEAFRNKRIRYLSLSFAMMIFGWSNYFSFSPVFMLKRFQFTALYNSMYMAVMGVGFAIGTSFLVEIFTKRFSLKNVSSAGMAVAAVGSVIAALSYQLSVQWVLVLVNGAAAAVAYSVILTIFSNAVSEGEQGWVMGVTGSVMALIFGLTSFLTGFAANWSEDTPLWFAAGGLTVSAILTYFVKEK